MASMATFFDIKIPMNKFKTNEKRKRDSRFCQGQRPRFFDLEVIQHGGGFNSKKKCGHSLPICLLFLDFSLIDGSVFV